MYQSLKVTSKAKSKHKLQLFIHYNIELKSRMFPSDLTFIKTLLLMWFHSSVKHAVPAVGKPGLSLLKVQIPFNCELIPLLSKSRYNEFINVLNLSSYFSQFLKRKDYDYVDKDQVVTLSVLSNMQFRPLVNLA